MKTYKAGAEQLVDITDDLQDLAFQVPPPQWLTFLVDPEKCDVGSIYFRRRLPLYQERKVIDYGGLHCDGLCFEHTVFRGRIFVVVLIIEFIAVVVGAGYSILKQDVSAGFTLAVFVASIPIPILSLLMWESQVLD